MLEKHGVHAEIRMSYGATEAKIPDIADAVVEITETGRALAAARLRIVDTLLVSRTELIANPVSASDPDKRLAMGHLLTLLQGALEARGKVLLKLNVTSDKLEAVVSVLPALKSPTVSELSGGAGYAVETVVPEVGGERVDPRAQGPGRHRHHRAAAVEDRALRFGPTTMTHARGGARAPRTGRGRRVRRPRGLGVVRADDGSALSVPLHRARRRDQRCRGGYPRRVLRVSRPRRALRGSCCHDRANRGNRGSRLTVCPGAARVREPGLRAPGSRPRVVGGHGPHDLDEGEADLRQGVVQGALGFTEPARQALHQRGHGVDGQAGLIGSGRLLRQMDGGQLEQAVGVVGHDDLGRGAQQLTTKLV